MSTVRRLARSRATIAVFTALVTAGVVGGISLTAAQSAGGGSTFFACTSSSGAVRPATIQVNAPPTCSNPGDTVTSWNAQGPQGVSGTPGAAGATGPQGPVGQASVVAFPQSDCLTPPTPNGDVAAPSGAFLNIPSIPGDSVDSHHANQIDVLSWSWGTSSSSTGSHSCGGGGGAGKVSFHDLTIVKHTDKASPKIFLAAVQGTNLTTITLAVAKNGTDYLTLDLDNAVATSHQMLGTGGGDPVPKEQDTFDGTKATLKFHPVNPDGTLGPPVVACFDAVAQTAC